MKFKGRVYSGNSFLGEVNANCMAGIKQKASFLCNRYHNPVDVLRVYYANWQDIDEVKFTRINKVSPNNRVIRGSWR